MFRTIIALLLALVVSIIIGLFQIVGLDITSLLANIGNTEYHIQNFKDLFEVLLLPYSKAIGGVYGPLVALGVGGFISGLVSKSGVRMLFVSIIGIVVFFLGYAVFAGGIAVDWGLLLAEAEIIYIDLGVSFALLFVPGIIGASLTAEDY